MLSSPPGVAQRRTWVEAGGDLPAFQAVDLGDGATDPWLGEGAVQDSSFNCIGVECFASCRIILGSSPHRGRGGLGLSGLPVVPATSTGHGRNVGYGFLYDMSGNQPYFVNVVLDPYFSNVLPVMFANYLISGEEPRHLRPVSGNDLSLLVSSTSPVALVEGTIVNLSLQYEGVVG